MTTPSGLAPNDETSSKKKVRLNPARRKAARAKTAPQGDDIRLQPQCTTSSPTTPIGKPSPPTKPPQQKKAPRPSNPPRTRTAPLPNSTPQPPPQPGSRNLAKPTSIQSPQSTLALAAPALLTGGLVGCAASAAILLGVGLWHDFAGASSALLAAQSAKITTDNLTTSLIDSLKTGTYSADEALDVLRRTTLVYADGVPGGKVVVERVFAEVAMVRRQRGGEVDRVVAETHGELTRAGGRGADAREMRGIVLGGLGRLAGFAGGVGRDVVARNPGLIGGRELEGEGSRTVRVNMAVRQKGPVRRASGA